MEDEEPRVPKGLIVAGATSASTKEEKRGLRRDSLSERVF
jgi:hypothetical protein